MKIVQTALCSLLVSALCGTAAAQVPKKTLNIDPQPMRFALKDLGEQTGLQIMFRAEDVGADELRAPKISGELSPREALDQMLANTALTYQFVNSNTVLVSAGRGEEKA